MCIGRTSILRLCSTVSTSQTLASFLYNRRNVDLYILPMAATERHMAHSPDNNHKHLLRLVPKYSPLLVPTGQNGLLYSHTSVFLDHYSSSDHCWSVPTDADEPFRFGDAPNTTIRPVKRNISNRLHVVFSRTLASAGKELKDNFLRALAEREEANRSGKMTVPSKFHKLTLQWLKCKMSSGYLLWDYDVSVSVKVLFQVTMTRIRTHREQFVSFSSRVTLQNVCDVPFSCCMSCLLVTSVIFIRDHNTLGQEVSGYIDYAHRLKTQDFEPYFSGKKQLMPGRSDLCYYNWKTQVSTSNSSPNFEVIYDDPNGLLFKNKRDKKILNVDPSSGPGEDSNRTFLQSDLYVHVVIYDHNIRTV
ncbi:hypothetical protein F2P81_014413 [Scophthalmus maximus]|uniref:Cilia- and flagella-associated protein 299 n=1 Tax=Scophthalmus maximus TaxID=52904 RepID=A0A6A4SMD0_SCOMX|nr:hypothetical protein F2P81_014413 [Scophthalmus maximus]